MRHEYFGEIHFEAGDDSVALPAIASDRGPIEVEIETVDGALRQRDLDVLAAACRARDAWAAVATAALRERFEELLRDALDVWCEGDG